MSEENKAPDAEQTKSDERPVWEERKFQVCNATRSRNNRTLRAQQPKHHGLKQFLAGGKYRIMRGRPVMMTESEIMSVMPELREKVLSGALEIRTLDGRLVDIETGREAASVPPPPLPNPPLDSIENDTQNVGQRMPQYPGGSTELDPEGDVPALVSKAVTDEETPTQAPPPPAAEAEKTAAPEGTSEDVPALVGGTDLPESSESKEEELDDIFSEDESDEKETDQ